MPSRLINHSAQQLLCSRIALPNDRIDDVMMKRKKQEGEQNENIVVDAAEHLLGIERLRNIDEAQVAEKSAESEDENSEDQEARPFTHAWNEQPA